MTDDSAIVIIGGGLAGAKAAEAARKAGHSGPISLVGDEQAAPYERPPLSKEVLRGDKDAGSTRIHTDDFYVEHNIELIRSSAQNLDITNARVTLENGRELQFDSAILAPGAAPRQLDVPGSTLDGVHYLRTIDDANRLSEAIRNANRVAVIGTGWIGSEVAATARQMGAEVVLIGPDAVPLQRVLGKQIGAVFAQLHADKGVTLRLGTQVAALTGNNAVEGVVLSDGQIETADVVVVGIGVTPRTELAEKAGLKVDNGVVVDEHLRSSTPNIYAAGDVANAWHPEYNRHLRLEHWSTAFNQGKTAGLNAAGGNETYNRLPSFFSDQYDLGLEYVGLGSADDDIVIRGDLNGREFVAFWHRNGIVTAAMNVNVWEVGKDLKRIVSTHKAMDLKALADTSIALETLA